MSTVDLINYYIATLILTFLAISFGRAFFEMWWFRKSK